MVLGFCGWGPTEEREGGVGGVLEEEGEKGKWTVGWEFFLRC